MGWHITSKEGESYINPLVDKVIKQYRGLLGTYCEEVIKMSNTVLSECGTLKKDMSLSPKIIRRRYGNYQNLGLPLRQVLPPTTLPS